MLVSENYTGAVMLYTGIYTVRALVPVYPMQFHLRVTKRNYYGLGAFSLILPLKAYNEQFFLSGSIFISEEEQSNVH